MSARDVHQDVFDADDGLAAFATDVRAAADATPLPAVGDRLAQLFADGIPSAAAAAATATGRRRSLRRRVALVLGAGVALTGSGLGVAGALPAPVQRAVADIADVVGIELPSPDTGDAPPPAPATPPSTVPVVPPTTGPPSTLPPPAQAPDRPGRPADPGADPPGGGAGRPDAPAPRAGANRPASGFEQPGRSEPPGQAQSEQTPAADRPRATTPAVRSRDRAVVTTTTLDTPIDDAAAVDDAAPGDRATDRLAATKSPARP